MILQTLVTGIAVGGIYALMAVGYSLVFSVLKFSNFAHGSVIMLGAYAGYFLLTLAGAAALAFARLGLSYEDAAFISLHGREENGVALLDAVRRAAKVVIFTGPAYPPQRVSTLLTASGFGERQVHVFSNLSLPEEKSFAGKARELAVLPEPFPNAVVVVLG